MGTFVKKTPEEMALAVKKRTKGLTGQEMFNLISEVMRENRDNPANMSLRNQIREHFKKLQKEEAA